MFFVTLAFLSSVFLVLSTLFCCVFFTDLSFPFTLCSKTQGLFSCFGVLFCFSSFSFLLSCPSFYSKRFLGPFPSVMGFRHFLCSDRTLGLGGTLTLHSGEYKKLVSPFSKVKWYAFELLLYFIIRVYLRF